MDLMKDLGKTDPEVLKQIKNELCRVRDGVELIASENFVSKAVLQAYASVFTNKYSEGYPSKRYYSGNEFVDNVEDLAIERAKKLFKAEHANVQPLSGAPANLAVFFCLLEIGDKFMGLDLSAGGHLTHGSPVNFSGKNYNCVAYNVDKESGLLDMGNIRKIAEKEKPKLILSGLTTYPRKLDFKEFGEIAKDVGAYHMADIAHIAGLCVTGYHQNPVPYSDVVTTTTHKTLRGPRGGLILCKKQYAKAIDKAVFPGTQGGPHDHMQAAKAVAFKEALQPDFKKYIGQVVKNSKALAEELMSLGVKLVTDGTDNHLMLIDLTPKGLTGKGKEVQNSLEEAGIFTNRNTIPYEPNTPFNPSGLRIGTPAVTTRGFKESEMKEIAKGISLVIDNYEDKKIIQKVKKDILELCKQFPLYKGLEILK